VILLFSCDMINTLKGCAEMEQNFKRIEEMLATLIQMVGSNNAKLDTMNGKQDIMDSKQDAMESDIKEMKGDIKEIKGDINAMKSDISSLKEGQDRQDRILESVTMKSFEHDTYIRDFKRKI
jgi:peptidoglycan hydrolase CwlO-like protein